MPVKTPKGWYIDFRIPNHYSKRFRKTFPTKSEALRYKNFIISTYTDDWNEAKKDSRKLSELIDIWFHHFGIALKSGKQRHRILIRLADSLFDPVSSSFDTVHYLAYRSNRLNDGLSGHTLNRELAYLKALYNELIRSGHYKGCNPVSQISLLKMG